MRRRHLGTRHAWFTLLCVIGCEVPQPNNGGPESVPPRQFDSVIGGSPSTSRPEIGRLVFGGSSCTATLIRPRVAVTAAHCVQYASCQAASCLPHRAHLEIESSNQGTQRFPLAAFTSFNQGGSVPPGRRSRFRTPVRDSAFGSYKLNHDVALLLLSQAVPSDVARPTSLASAYPKRRDALTLWGYGCTDTRTQAGAGTKRYFDRVEGQGTSKNLCPGDSGGPVTLGRKGPVLYVNSGYLSWNAARNNDIDIFGDVPDLRTQITSQIQGWRHIRPTKPTKPISPRPHTPAPRQPDPEESDRWDDGSDAWDDDNLLDDPEGFERRLRERIERQIGDGAGGVTIEDHNSSSVVTINGRRIRVEGSNTSVSVINGKLTVNGKAINLNTSKRTIRVEGATIHISPKP